MVSIQCTIRNAKRGVLKECLTSMGIHSDPHIVSGFLPYLKWCLQTDFFFCRFSAIYSSEDRILHILYIRAQYTAALLYELWLCSYVGHSYSTLGHAVDALLHATIAL